MPGGVASSLLAWNLPSSLQAATARKSAPSRYIYRFVFIKFHLWVVSLPTRVLYQIPVGIQFIQINGPEAIGNGEPPRLFYLQDEKGGSGGTGMGPAPDGCGEFCRSPFMTNHIPEVAAFEGQ